MFYSDDDKLYFRNIRENARETFSEDMLNNCIQKDPKCDYKNFEEIDEYVDTYQYLSALYLSHGKEKVLFELGMN